jgi:hypothetical protein
MNANLFVFYFAGLLFFSCNNQANNIQPNVRAALRATGTGSIKATVFVEGIDGNSLSGAIVNIRDNCNAILQLNYDSVACSYTGLIEELPGESIYQIEVKSIIAKENIILQIPYSKLSTAPDIIIFQDMLGNSVLSGQSIESAQPIQIGWNGSGDGVIYQVTIRTALKIVYATSTNDHSIILTAGSIPTGNYYLEVSSQKVHGDVYFKTSPYYSLSFINASQVSCDVN